MNDRTRRYTPVEHVATGAERLVLQDVGGRGAVGLQKPLLTGVLLLRLPGLLLLLVLVLVPDRGGQVGLEK